MFFLSEGQTETVISSEQIVRTEENAPTESPVMKQEQKDQDEQGTSNTSHMMSE